MNKFIIKLVGFVNNKNSISRIVKIILMLFKYLIFLFSFVCVDSMNKNVMIIIIINWVVKLLLIFGDK